MNSKQNRYRIPANCRASLLLCSIYLGSGTDGRKWEMSMGRLLGLKILLIVPGIVIVRKLLRDSSNKSRYRILLRSRIDNAGCFIISNIVCQLLLEVHGLFSCTFSQYICFNNNSHHHYILALCLQQSQLPTRPFFHCL